MKRIEKIPATYDEQVQERSMKRVAIYARVSTMYDAQNNSYEAQVSYFMDYIRLHENWQLVGIYADRGISGTRAKNRPEFLKMIEDCYSGSIDLIVTKSVSRFARNTVDTLNILRELKSKDIGVFFQRENILSTDANGEFLLTLLASFAQEESRSISENVKWSIRKRFEKGEYSVPYAQFLGYNKGMLIDQEQAVIVRFIYRSFLQGYATSTIRNLLVNAGVPTPAGKKKWYSTVVDSILRNEKYKGDALLQKTYIEDFITHKKCPNNGKLPKYYIHNDHEAIIAPFVHELVQERLKQPLYSGKLMLSDKIICTRCGEHYARLVWHSTSYADYVWKCVSFRRNGGYCRNTHIYEDSLYKAIGKAWIHLLETHAAAVKECMGIVGEVAETDISAGELYDAAEENAMTDLSDFSLLCSRIMIRPSRQIEFQFINGDHFVCVIPEHTTSNPHRDTGYSSI